MSAIDAAALQPLEPATGSTLPSPCLTWPLYQQAAGLFELESSTAAPQLLSNLGVALHAAVPSGAPSEPLYTPFWDKVGLGLPESACSILRFDVSVSRYSGGCILGSSSMLLQHICWLQCVCSDY